MVFGFTRRLGRYEVVALLKWFLVNVAAWGIIKIVRNDLFVCRRTRIHAARIRHPQGCVSRRLSAKEMRHRHVHDGFALRGGGGVPGHAMPGGAGQ